MNHIFVLINEPHHKGAITSVFGAYTSMKKAVEAVEKYIAKRKTDYYCDFYGDGRVVEYITKGQSYFIEKVELDKR